MLLIDPEVLAQPEVFAWAALDITPNRKRSNTESQIQDIDSSMARQNSRGLLCFEPSWCMQYGTTLRAKPRSDVASIHM